MWPGIVATRAGGLFEPTGLKEGRLEANFCKKDQGWSVFKGSGGERQERHEAAREGWRLAPPSSTHTVGAASAANENDRG